MGDASLPAPPPPPPPARSRAPLVVGVAVLVILGAAAAAALGLSRASDHCGDASFTSERFGYCLDVTGAWVAGSTTIGDARVDRLALPRAPGYITIQAVGLDPGSSLDDVVSTVRGDDERSGYEATAPIPGTVGGVDARAWDVTAATSVGSTTQLREVVFVRDGVVWRIQLGDTPEAFDVHAAELDRMLETWRFA